MYKPVITLGMSLSGDPSAFDEAAQTTFKTDFANLTAFNGKVTASDVQVSIRSDRRRARLLQSGTYDIDVQVILPDMPSAEDALAALQSETSSSLSSTLPVTVNSVEPPAVRSLAFDAPSPPPPSPPPPSPSPSPPVPSILGGLIQALDTGDNLSSESTAGKLSSEMIWVIIVTIVLSVIILGCAFAYFMGKRSGKGRIALVGRPALRRQITPEEHSREHVQPTVDSSAIPNVRVEDVRLIELGMAVERTMQMQRQVSGSTMAAPALEHEISNTSFDPRDSILEGLSPRQVRDSLSPRSPRSPRTPESPRASPAQPGIVDTRIRATANLDSF